MFCSAIDCVLPKSKSYFFHLYMFGTVFCTARCAQALCMYCIIEAASIKHHSSSLNHLCRLILQVGPPDGQHLHWNPTFHFLNAFLALTPPPFLSLSQTCIKGSFFSLKLPLKAKYCSLGHFHLFLSFASKKQLLKYSLQKLRSFPTPPTWSDRNESHYTSLANALLQLLFSPRVPLPHICSKSGFIQYFHSWLIMSHCTNLQIKLFGFSFLLALLKSNLYLKCSSSIIYLIYTMLSI